MFRQAELLFSRTGVRIGIHSMITRRDEYFFDLNGYTVIPQALDHDHVVSINAWIDALPQLKTGEWFGKVYVQSYGDIDGINLQDIIEAGENVDVSGTSKGRGFAGVMKRWNFGGGPRTHGQSDRMRAPGSIGGGTTPGKVYKGLKMGGHMGNRRITVKGLEIIEIDAERNLLMIKGGIPGATNSLVHIRRAGA